MKFHSWILSGIIVGLGDELQLSKVIQEDQNTTGTRLAPSVFWFPFSFPQKLRCLSTLCTPPTGALQLINCVLHIPQDSLSLVHSLHDSSSD